MKIKCPRCNKTYLHKFGKDHRNNKQKYRCLSCFRQFRVGDGYGKQLRRHPWLPKCPKCNAGLDIYKWRKHFKRLRCRTCNYKFNVYSIPEEVLDYISRLTFGKTNFLRMRHAKEVILRAIKLCYEFGLSSRDISKNFYVELGLTISNVTIHQWCKKFAALFSQHVEDVTLDLSKTWHIDETVIKIKGKKHWVYAVLCRESRFVISWYLSKSHSTDAAIKVLQLAVKRAGFRPNKIISDRHPLYKEMLNFRPKFSRRHVFVQMYSTKLNNNRLERFFGTLKSRCKRARGFKSFYSVCCFLTIYFVYYNYFRAHSALKHKAPAEVAGFKPILPDRWVSVFSF